MSEKDKIIQLLDYVPEYKLGYVLAYVQGITADEDSDDEYCRKLYEEYLNDTDPEKEEESLTPSSAEPETRKKAWWKFWEINYRLQNEREL